MQIKIINRFNGNLQGLNIAVWGLAFKPNTDDIREAPALFIIEKLLAAGATVKAFDPEAMPNVQKTLGDRIIYVNEPYEALIELTLSLLSQNGASLEHPDLR